MKAVAAVRRAVSQVNATILVHPLSVLTEADIQARLYAALVPHFGGLQRVSNTFVWGTPRPRPLMSLMSVRLHSELRLLRGSVDLAILDLSATRFAFNSKGRFGHAQLQPGDHIFIELKATRTHRSQVSTRARWKDLIHADLEKLSQYAWPSLMLCYDFDFHLVGPEVADLKRRAGPRTQFLYFKDTHASCYFENGSAER